MNPFQASNGDSNDHGSRQTASSAISGSKHTRKRRPALLAQDEVDRRVRQSVAEGAKELDDRSKAATQSAQDLRLKLEAGFDCCKGKCATLVPADAAFEQRRLRMLMTREEDRRSDLATRRSSAPQNTYFIAGVPVCQKFFLFVLGTSTTALRSVRQDRILRVKPNRENIKESNICAWLDELALYGDRMPDNLDVYIPYPTFMSVYALYQEDNPDTVPSGEAEDELHPSMNVSVSESYFLRVWRTLRPRIKTRRVTRFALCDTCEQFDQLEKAHRGDHARRSQIIADRNEHLLVIKNERQAYYNNQKRASEDRKSYLSLILDGADQSSFGLPHFFQRTKETSGMKVPMKLYGVLSHGRGAYAFTVPPQAPTGSNLTIEILYRVMKDVKQTERQLPRTLFLQLDNTTGQNKNNYVMAFLALLVGWKTLDEVFINFLPVGHTHEDIDQMFSRFATYNRTHDALTHFELLQNCRMAYHPEPRTQHVEIQANVSQALDDLGRDFKKFPHITEPLGFKIHRDLEGRPECFVKALVASVDGWKTSLRLPAEHGHLWFPDGVPDREEFLSSLPPIRFEAMPRTDVESIEATLEKCKDRLGDNVHKLAVLYDLLSDARQNQTLDMNWDISVFEPPCTKGDFSDGDEDHDEDNDVEDEDHLREILFSTGDMLVIRVDRTADKPFWIAQVASNCFQGDKTVDVVWFSLNSRGKDPWAHAYVEARDPTDKSRLFTDTINASTVILRFDALTDTNRIPPQVVRNIQRVESSLKY